MGEVLVVEKIETEDRKEMMKVQELGAFVVVYSLGIGKNSMCCNCKHFVGSCDLCTFLGLV